MSDEEYEKNMTEEQKEAVKKLRTKIPLENAKELTISAEVNPKMIKKSEWFDNKASTLAEQLRELGENVDSEEITPETFGKYVSLLKDKIADVKRDADPTSKPSSGSLTIEGNRQNYDSEKDEWDSVADMVRDLQTIKRTGTAKQRKYAKEVLNKMLLKAMSGTQEKASLEGKFVSSVKDEDTLEGVIEKLNREYRERRKLKSERDEK